MNELKNTTKHKEHVNSAAKKNKSDPKENTQITRVTKVRESVKTYGNINILYGQSKSNS